MQMPPSAILAATLAGLVAAAPTTAGTRQPAFTSDRQVKCQKEVGRNLGKLFDSTLRAWAKC